MLSSDGTTSSNRPKAEPRRRHERRAGIWPAHLETTSGRRLDCIVFDISSGGAKVRLDAPIADGEVVTFISKRFGKRGARVAWTAPRRAGLIFLSQAAAKDGDADPAFLRRRAELLRELAAGADSGIRLARLAEVFERKAGSIEQRRLAPPLTIRKDRRPAPVDQ